MRTHRRWAVDGTFAVAPRPFKQSFVMGAFVDDNKVFNLLKFVFLIIFKIVVCAHALLPGKNARYYCEALNAIKTAAHPILPHRGKISRIFSDFIKNL